MGLPNVAVALRRFAVAVTIKTVTKTTVNFAETDTVATRTVQAVVQPADKAKLNPDQIDWAQSYYMVHALDKVNLGEYVFWNGADYKVIDQSDFSENGYWLLTVESTGRAPL